MNRSKISLPTVNGLRLFQSSLMATQYLKIGSWPAVRSWAVGENTFDSNRRDTSNRYASHVVKMISNLNPEQICILSEGDPSEQLVYLHRYNRNTVDVVLRYLRDYKTKIRAQIAVLKGNNDAQSVRDLMKYEKIDKDLDEYEQMLYSLALKHIELDLDDGVKVNYGKLGSVLYPVDGLNREKK